jgi:hypothetical protein
LLNWNNFFKKITLLIMKKSVIIFYLFAFILVSCNAGYKNQSWQPKAGKPMKKGYNHKN